MTRNVFPPTPPPESEKGPSSIPSGGSGAGGMNGRALSVRNGSRPAQLNLPKQPDRYQVQQDRPAEDATERPRLGPTRSVSESRAPNRSYSARSTGGRPRDRTMRKQPTDVVEEEEYPDDLYDLYRQSRISNNPSRRGGPSKSQRPRNIEEEDELNSDYTGSSFDENDFEMISNRKTNSGRERAQSRTRAGSRRPDIRKVSGGLLGHFGPTLFQRPFQTDDAIRFASRFTPKTLVTS
jgi:hypothetical protein